jgi:morphogenetic protein associated with SpoVID
VKIHIVQKGDTLWKIAKKYGVNFEELKQMNTQLSNPDMIMPGMKIKVPTTGGTIKKEAPLGSMPAKINYGSKKEMPISKPPIVKEQPKTLPIKEAPIQMPIKEAPIQMPIKEAPIMEMPVKEAPMAPYVPKMPQPIIPEIDINNYYMMNMANMSIQPPPPAPQLPPKPVNILPEVKEEPIAESPESIPAPIQQPIQGGLQQPMVPYPQYCYPISPVLPGSGLPCPPVPCPPGYPMMPYPQVQGAMMPQQMPYQPGVLGVTDESSSFMPQMPTQTAPIVDTQMPAYPAYPAYPQTAPMMQMPYGHVPYCGPLYPISPVLPGSGLPAGQFPYGFQQPTGFPQVQGVMDVDSPDMVSPQFQMPQAMPMQQMTPPPSAGTADCGCGGPKHHLQAQGMPYPQVAPMHQGMPYSQAAPMHQGMPYPQTAPMHQGMPYPQEAPMSQGMPYPQAAPMPQGAPSLPPGYGQGMAPYYGQTAQGQPPVMNPYGTNPMGGAFSMPRYNDESSEYAG